MIEDERRTKLLEGFTRADEITRGVIESSIELFAQDRDFERLLGSAREAYQVARRYYPFVPISFAAAYADRLALIRGELNRVVIQESQERGVSPWPNWFGERLEAMTCLAQFLETEEKR